MSEVRFSPASEKVFEETIRRYPKRDAALLPVLWLAQQEFGYLSQDVLSYVAERVGVSLARVESVVSFYTLYRRTPSGKFHIQLCRNISCVLGGCDSVREWIEKDLGLKPGETSADGMFTYDIVECIAACGGAPALQVNFKYFENMNPGKVKELIQELREHGEDRLQKF